jgi:glycosyltransferase involved in cell wall biosynthesis
LDEYVKNNSKFGGKVKIIRQEKRQGLMRSRMEGIRTATSDVLVFLDSHIEAGIGWLEPLLFRIQEDPKVVKTNVITWFMRLFIFVFREAKYMIIHLFHQYPVKVFVTKSLQPEKIIIKESNFRGISHTRGSHIESFTVQIFELSLKLKFLYSR